MVVLRLLTITRRSVCLARHSGRATQTFQIGRCQPFNRKSGLVDDGDNSESTTKAPRPKTVPVPKITLLLPDNSMTVTVLVEAERLAKRRNLNLVKIGDLDSKTQRPLYKLVSSAALIQETVADEADDTESDRGTKERKDSKFKDIKILRISAKIAEHDARVKARNVVKLLSKRHQVKVIISLDDTVESKAQRIIEEMVRNKGTVRQMPAKKNFVQLLISPLLDKSEDGPACNKE